MRTLIISDIHLSHIFEESKFLFLRDLFSSVDNVILNGDFWDGYHTTFDVFVSSPWKQLFPILKNKKTVHIFGNHDQKRLSDNRTSLFSDLQEDSYILNFKKVIYHIEHGHMLSPSIDTIYPLSLKLLYYINILSQGAEHMLTLLQSPHNKILKYQNLIIKKKLHNKQFPHWYICGHTHYSEIDRVNKFANSGFIQFRKASYLIIDSSGISLQSNRY